MTYPFEKIREIRKIRKRRSEFKLNSEKALLAKAEQKLHSRENELAEHREQRFQKEQSLYNEIIRKPLSLNEFKHFQLEIDYMREAEQEHLSQVEQAEKEKIKAVKNVDEALSDFYLRTREKLKIDEHRTEWNKIEAVEIDRRLENESDEIGQAFNQFNKQNE